MAAAEHGIKLKVVKLRDAKSGFVLLPQALGRREILCLGHPLPRACPRYERLAEALRGLHFVAFACLMFQKAVSAIPNS